MALLVGQQDLFESRPFVRREYPHPHEVLAHEHQADQGAGQQVGVDRPPGSRRPHEHQGRDGRVREEKHGPCGRDLAGVAQMALG